MAVAHAPKIGMGMLLKIMALTTDGSLANLGVDEKHLPKVRNTTPSERTLNNLLHDLVVDIICLTSEHIKTIFFVNIQQGWEFKQFSLICQAALLVWQTER